MDKGDQFQHGASASSAGGEPLLGPLGDCETTEKWAAQVGADSGSPDLSSGDAE